MLQSQILQRTPSIYFKFDDQSHRNMSKSSLALDYSISNHKYILSNRIHPNKNHQTTHKQQSATHKQQSATHKQPLTTQKQPLTTQKQPLTTPKQKPLTPIINQNQLSPSYNMKKNTLKQTNQDHQTLTHYQHTKRNFSSLKKPNRLETQEFFKQFDTKYDITFDRQNDIFINQWIPQAQNQEGSKISRGNLFDDFQPELTLMPIKIESKKSSNYSNTSHELHQQMTSSNLINFTHTNEMAFSSQLSLDQNHKTDAQINPQNYNTNQNSIENFSNKQNNQQNNDTEFQEIISFGPSNNQTKIRKYRQMNSKHFMTKDFQNNSSLLEKVRPVLQLKRRVPLKSIENLIQKSSKEKQSQLTRKKPIINADLFISTINKTDKNQTKQNTNCVWSNPINNKKSISLESTFGYDNVFKTNAFRETLKSTTLQNWKKKYHQKIENIGDRKTVTKKRRENNIFNNLFIRA